MARPSPCPSELRERAVRMVAAKPDIGAAQTVRTWVRTAQVDAGQRPGTTSEEAAEIKRLPTGSSLP